MLQVFCVMKCAVCEDSKQSWQLQHDAKKQAFVVMTCSELDNYDIFEKAKILTPCSVTDMTLFMNSNILYLGLKGHWHVNVVFFAMKGRQYMYVQEVESFFYQQCFNV